MGVCLCWPNVHEKKVQIRALSASECGQHGTAGNHQASAFSDIIQQPARDSLQRFFELLEVPHRKRGLGRSVGAVSMEQQRQPQASRIFTRQWTNSLRKHIEELQLFPMLCCLQVAIHTEGLPTIFFQVSDSAIIRPKIVGIRPTSQLMTQARHIEESAFL
jgi:hypothetical protein